MQELNRDIIKNEFLYIWKLFLKGGLLIAVQELADFNLKVNERTQNIYTLISFGLASRFFHPALEPEQIWNTQVSQHLEMHILIEQNLPPEIHLNR
jgi:hypothetical protein